MSPAVRAALLNLIQSEWNQRAKNARPDRLWILEFPHANVTGNDIDSDTAATQFWVLDDNGLHEQCIIQWHRLDAIRRLGPVDGGVQKPGGGSLRLFETGFANFAPLPESNQYYLDWIFGPLYGEGRRVQIDSSGVLQAQSNLWLS